MTLPGAGEDVAEPDGGPREGAEPDGAGVGGVGAAPPAPAPARRPGTDAGGGWGRGPGRGGRRAVLIGLVGVLGSGGVRLSVDGGVGGRPAAGPPSPGPFAPDRERPGALPTHDPALVAGRSGEVGQHGEPWYVFSTGDVREGFGAPQIRRS